MTRDIEANPNIKPFYRPRLRNMFSVLLKHKIKPPEVNDEDDAAATPATTEGDEDDEDVWARIPNNN